MKYAAMLLMLAGFFLVLTALVLFDALALRTVFVLSGCAVEALGMVLSIRTHMMSRKRGVSL